MKPSSLLATVLRVQVFANVERNLRHPIVISVALAITVILTARRVSVTRMVLRAFSVKLTTENVTVYPTLAANIAKNVLRDISISQNALRANVTHSVLNRSNVISKAELVHARTSMQA